MKKIFLSALLLAFAACSSCDRNVDDLTVPMSERVDIMKISPVPFCSDNITEYWRERSGKFMAIYSNPDIFDFSDDEFVDAKVRIEIDERSFELLVLCDSLSGTIEWCSECRNFHLICDGFDYDD